MNNFIKAMKIFLKYMNEDVHYPYPFCCEHNVMYFHGVCPDLVSLEDKQKLYDLGFFVDEDIVCFASYVYGSC